MTAKLYFKMSLEYFKASKELYEMNNCAEYVYNFLFCHSIELGLKGYLIHIGYEANDLKKEYGHELDNLFKKVSDELSKNDFTSFKDRFIKWKRRYSSKDINGEVIREEEVVYKTFYLKNKYPDLKSPKQKISGSGSSISNYFDPWSIILKEFLKLANNRSI